MARVHRTHPCNPYVAWRTKIQKNGRQVEGHKRTDGQGRVMKGAVGSARSTWAATDWPQIVGWYDELPAVTRSPVVAVNRAIALSRVEGALSGLAALGLARSAPEHKWLAGRRAL